MGGVGTAVIASAVIGAGSSAYGAEKQKKAAEDEQEKRERAMRLAKMESDQIAKETRPDAESASGTLFGSGQDSDVGSVSDFIVPKSSMTSMGSSTKSGLGA